MPINRQRPATGLANSRNQRLYPWNVYEHSTVAQQGRKLARPPRTPCLQETSKQSCEAITYEYCNRRPKSQTSPNGEQLPPCRGEFHSEQNSVGDGADISGPPGCGASLEEWGDGGTRRRPRRYEEILAYKGAAAAPKPSLAADCRNLEHNTLALFAVRAAQSGEEDENDDDDEEELFFLGSMPKDERELCHATAALLSRLSEVDAQRVLVSIAQESEATRMLELYGGMTPGEREEGPSDGEKDSVSALLTRLRVQWQQRQRQRAPQPSEDKRQAWLRQNSQSKPGNERRDVRSKGRSNYPENLRAPSSNNTSRDRGNCATNNSSPSTARRRSLLHNVSDTCGAPSAAVPLRTRSPKLRPQEHLNRSPGNIARLIRASEKSDNTRNDHCTHGVEHFSKKIAALEENQKNLLPAAAIDTRQTQRFSSEFSSASPVHLPSRLSSIPKKYEERRSCSILTTDATTPLVSNTSASFERPPLAPSPSAATAEHRFKRVEIGCDLEPSTPHRLPQQESGDLDGARYSPDSGQKMSSTRPFPSTPSVSISPISVQQSPVKGVVGSMPHSGRNSTDIALTATTEDVNCTTTWAFNRAPIPNSTQEPPKANNLPAEDDNEIAEEIPVAVSSIEESSQSLPRQECDKSHISTPKKDGFDFDDDKLPWED